MTTLWRHISWRAGSSTRTRRVTFDFQYFFNCDPKLWWQMTSDDVSWEKLKGIFCVFGANVWSNVCEYCIFGSQNSKNIILLAFLRPDIYYWQDKRAESSFNQKKILFLVSKPDFFNLVFKRCLEYLILNV